VYLGLSGVLYCCKSITFELFCTILAHRKKDNWEPRIAIRGAEYSRKASDEADDDDFIADVASSVKVEKPEEQRHKRARPSNGETVTIDADDENFQSSEHSHLSEGHGSNLPDPYPSNSSPAAPTSPEVAGNRNGITVNDVNDMEAGDEPVDNTNALVAELQAKLDEANKKLTNLRTDVYELLKLVATDLTVVDMTTIDAIVRDMIVTMKSEQEAGFDEDMMMK
jgi:hypothetical protein